MPKNLPTTIDDAFVEGWYFGRFGREANFHPSIPTRAMPLAIRAEYERGVYEGAMFEEKFSDPRDWVMTVRGFERRP